MLSSTPIFEEKRIREKKRALNPVDYTTLIASHLSLLLWFIFNVSHHFHIQSHDRLGCYLENILSPSRVPGMWSLPDPLTLGLTLAGTWAWCRQRPGRHACHWMTAVPSAHCPRLATTWTWTWFVSCGHAMQLGSTEQRHLTEPTMDQQNPGSLV